MSRGRMSWSSIVQRKMTAFVARGAGALMVIGGAFMFSNRDRIVALAARHKLPASYPLREYVAAGGLMSYAPSITEAYRLVAIYAGRILKGVWRSSVGGAGAI